MSNRVSQLKSYNIIESGVTPFQIFIIDREQYTEIYNNINKLSIAAQSKHDYIKRRAADINISNFSS